MPNYTSPSPANESNHFNMVFPNYANGSKNRVALVEVMHANNSLNSKIVAAGAVTSFITTSSKITLKPRRIMASDLRPAELFKYDWRVEKFLEKYKTKSAFTTTDRKQVVLLPQEHIIALIEARNTLEMNKALLVTEKGVGVKLSQLQKTAEFGGKGGAVGTVVASPSGEAVHGLLARMHHLDTRYALNAPTATERGELMVLQDINQYILKLETPIDVNIGGKVYKNIYGANKVKGTPKADITLVSFNDTTKKFQDVYFLSHKLGTDSSGFQQYSGVSADADGSKPGAISQHPEVLAFLRQLAEVYDAIVDGRQRFYADIKDDALIGKAVYGPEFSGYGRHADNVNMIAQGNPILRPQGNTHALSFSAVASSFSTDISHFKSNGYKAILGARYGADRKFQVDGKVYNHVRVGIMPIKLLGSNAKPIGS